MSDLQAADTPFASADEDFGPVLDAVPPDVRDLLLSGIYTRRSFRKPSKVQSVAIRRIISTDENIIAQSQSGTGKTASFAIGILAKLHYGHRDPFPQALVLCNTREVAQQVATELREIGSALSASPRHLLRVECVLPPTRDRIPNVRAHVVVGTPGAVFSRLESGLLDHPEAFRMLVIDEADCMLARNLGRDCDSIRPFLAEAPGRRQELQIILVSATFPPEIRQKVLEFAPSSHKIRVQRDVNLKLRNVQNFRCRLAAPGPAAQFAFLKAIYQLCRVNTSIIFINHIDSARALAARLCAEGWACEALVGSLDPLERDRVLERFRAMSTRVLIASNVAARGLDVPAVSMVVSLDVPTEFADGGRPGGRHGGGGAAEPDFATYLHRVGRAGRFGRKGVAVDVVGSDDEWAMLETIYSHYEIEPLSCGEDGAEIVDFIRSLGGESAAPDGA